MTPSQAENKDVSPPPTLYSILCIVIIEWFTLLTSHSHRQRTAALPWLVHSRWTHASHPRGTHPRTPHPHRHSRNSHAWITGVHIVVFGRNITAKVKLRNRAGRLNIHTSKNRTEPSPQLPNLPQCALLSSIFIFSCKPGSGLTPASKCLNVPSNLRSILLLIKRQ